MKIKIIIVNGFPASGKDLFVDLCIKELGNNYNIKAEKFSSVANTKRAAKILGWNGRKTEKDRNALSELKDLSSTYWNGPFLSICEKINELKNNEWLFVFIREPDEIEKVVNKFPDAITVFVDRDNHLVINNHADQNVTNYNYTLIIDNNGDIDNLKQSVEVFVNDTI